MATKKKPTVVKKRKKIPMDKYIVVYHDGWERKVWSTETSKVKAQESIAELIDAEGISDLDIECYVVNEKAVCTTTKVVIE